jgi:S1-C subfamily serine protease
LVDAQVAVPEYKQRQEVSSLGDALNLAAISDWLSAAVEQAGQSVVRVEARRRIPASGIVWSDSYIVTADHAIQREDEITVGTADGTQAAATLVGRDATTDLALLRVDGLGQRAAQWAEPGALRVGQLVLALGRPGRTVRAVLGILGVVGEAWRTLGGAELERYVQPDLALPAGFSGGALVDMRGQAVGVNTSGLTRHPMTVPASSVRRVVEALAADGRIRRAYLGVGVQPVRVPQGLSAPVGHDAGLLILSVESGSPAERAGLLLGDTLLTLGGQSLRRPSDLIAFLSGERIGSSTTAQVLRGGRVMEVAVTAGERL